MASLEKITNALLLVTCLVVGGGAVYDRVVAGSHAVPVPLEGALVGRKVPLPVTPARRVDVLLFIRPGCPACEQNMSLYRSLVDMPGRQFDLTVVGYEREATRSYLDSYHLAPDFFVGADFGRFGVVATPTVLLTDATGIVKRAWIGSLEGKRREEFLKALAE